MFYSTSDEDDGSAFAVGMPPSGSKLQSLFGGETSPKGGNESLMYQPTKPPKAKEEVSEQLPVEQKDGPSLMYACACHTFRYTNGQYVNHGKLGVAVLGNYSTKDYKLLIYASQKKQVTSAKIHSSFALKIQKSNYATFYDEQSVNWSLCFDSEEQLVEVARRVALAKFNMSANVLVTQDLNCHTTQEIQKGDTVEVQYTGWLPGGNTFGKVFDTNENSGKLLKFKVGKGKIMKGLDLGIIGMRKLSKRLLIIPPELATEGKDVGTKFPHNSALIFQIDVTRVKFVNSLQDGDNVSLAGQIETEKSSITEDGRDIDESSSNSSQDSFLVRTKSISEQLNKNKPESTKSKLLERMSKMGQSMVPTSSSAVSVEDFVDEGETGKSQAEPTNPTEPSKPELKPKPDSPTPTPPTPATPTDNIHVPTPQASVPNIPSVLPLPQLTPLQTNPLFQPPVLNANAAHMYNIQQQQQQQLALYQSPQAVQAALFGFPPQVAALQPQMTSQQNNMSSTEMNLMLTDGRLKHTELKSDLNRIVDKIDTMSAKITSLENTNKQLQLVQPQQQLQQPQQMFTQGPEMEAQVIMRNVTRIIKENEKLRVECEEKTKKIELLNERMTDLLTKNQSFFEKSNQLLANQTDSMQNSATQAMAKVTHLEEHNIRLQTELATMRAQLMHSQGEKDMFSKNEGHLSNKIDTLTHELIQVKESADLANNLATDWGGQNLVYYDTHQPINNRRDQMFASQYQIGDNNMMAQYTHGISHKKSKSWRGWSKEEEIVLRKAFKDHYDGRVVPLYPDIVNAMTLYPLLAPRGKRNIKDKVRNDILRLQRSDDGPSVKMMKRSDGDGGELDQSPFSYIARKGDQDSAATLLQRDESGRTRYLSRDVERNSPFNNNGGFPSVSFNIAGGEHHRESTFNSMSSEADRRTPFTTTDINEEVRLPYSTTKKGGEKRSAFAINRHQVHPSPFGSSIEHSPLFNNTDRNKAMSTVTLNNNRGGEHYNVSSREELAEESSPCGSLDGHQEESPSNLLMNNMDHRPSYSPSSSLSDNNDEQRLSASNCIKQQRLSYSLASNSIRQQRPLYSSSSHPMEGQRPQHNLSNASGDEFRTSMDGRGGSPYNFMPAAAAGHVVKIEEDCVEDEEDVKGNVLFKQISYTPSH